MPARRYSQSFLVRATAPTRIDLAGGTLDIWPISMLVPGALTVNLAVDLPAIVTVAPRPDDRIRIVSEDRRRRITKRLPLRLDRIDGKLALLQRLVASFEPRRGLTLTSRAAAPAGAGLGGSSALGIAAAAALGRFTGAGLGGERLLRRVMNLETIQLRVPTGNQDYLAALHGGLAAYRHGADGTRREAIPIPRDLQRRLVLAYTGEPRLSGFSNWEMFRRFIDGEGVTVRRMEAIGRIARELRDALCEGDLDATGRLIGEEGRLRYRLAPSVATPLLLRAGTAARRAGALGVKVCGAGGGGCMIALARENRAGSVARAIASTGARLLEARIARRGVRVRSER
jgi:D-glycero-alpha-D-manno-heptose-7-phosphate kinase